MNKIEFVDITSFYPSYFDCGNYIITKSQISKEAIKNINEDSPFYPYKFQLSTNKDYVSLVLKLSDKPMMSNHETETITNQKFLDNVKGDVLIFGLGLGLIIFPLLEIADITSIDVVELDSGLIDFVGKKISERDKLGKVKVTEGDVFNFHNHVKKNYDTIYFDIWEFVGEKELREIDMLHKTYHKFLNKNGWIDSWRSEKKMIYGI